MLRKALHPRRRWILIRIILIALVIGFVVAWRIGGLMVPNSGGNLYPSDNIEPRDIENGHPVNTKAGVKDSDHNNDVLKSPLELPLNNNDDIGVKQKHEQAVTQGPLRPTDVGKVAKFDLEIQAAFDKVVPGLGDMGAAIQIDAHEQPLVDEVMKKEAFNILASDKITLNRTTPDNRHQNCKSVVYDHDLPSASVVIIFTNEAWSPLLRTVHTVLNYSPSHLLHEIILLDDFSDREELQGRLDRYLQKYLPAKVKLVRSTKRLGLIRARLEGARAATGNVLMFLDSHCEATVGWLEPLLQRIKENRHAVLLPIIDVIDDRSMEFYKNQGTYFQVGGFTWSGHFTWIPIPERELKRRGNDIAPTRSPTMAGGLFAVERKFFWDIGGYDEGMDVWGGENLEISFRVWMCGGLLETIPCSHVGHIFRSFHPYTFPGNKDTHGLNTARMAEVWMDDYKRLLYIYRNDLQVADYGNITGRKELRKRLQCTSFKWFLDNIYPEKFILDEDVLAYGKIMNGAVDNLCMDMLQRDEKHMYQMGLYQCHAFQSASQFMSLSKKGELRREEVCADVSEHAPSPTKLNMVTCNNNRIQQWVHTKHGTIKHKVTGKCIDALNSTSGDDVWVMDCNGSRSQHWSFEVYLDL